LPACRRSRRIPVGSAKSSITSPSSIFLQGNNHAIGGA
jgi:hypothetical protein